ncbi:MAG: HIT family protein [Actinobacteria bacterium]|nr:HIT family protein [Actinomycetota bacterium]
MEPALEEFYAKFRVVELAILETPFWTWSVRPAQPTLGAGVIALKRHAFRLADVTAEEMVDLAGLVGEVEARLACCFGYQIMNYLMLMMVDHHVHFHALPRYDGPREFAGHDWVDAGWPALPAFGDAQHADAPHLLLDIRRVLQEAGNLTR